MSMNQSIDSLIKPPNKEAKSLPKRRRNTSVNTSIASNLPESTNVGNGDKNSHRISTQNENESFQIKSGGEEILAIPKR